MPMAFDEKPPQAMDSEIQKRLAPKDIVLPEDIKPVKLCTPDYEFDTILVFRKGTFNQKLQRPEWTCACGEKFKYYEFLEQKEKARDVAWNAFMRHKFPDDWDKGERFNEVWDECFPAPVVTKTKLPKEMILLYFLIALWAFLMFTKDFI